MKTFLMVLFVMLAACGRPAEVPPATLTPTPTTSEQNMRLQGTVQPGVEAGCLILYSGGQEYLLLGGDPTVVRAGAEVVVEGEPRPGTVTTCQQGTPFAVERAESV